MLFHEMYLLIQTFILIMFLSSLFFKMKGKFFIHGTLMAAAVISTWVSFLWAINLNAIVIDWYLRDLFNPTEFNFPLFAVHTSITVLAVLLGTWIVISWRFRSNLFCALKKKLKLILT